MAAAPAESCQSLVPRSPRGCLGSLVDVRKRLRRMRRASSRRDWEHGREACRRLPAGPRRGEDWTPTRRRPWSDGRTPGAGEPRSDGAALDAQYPEGRRAAQGVRPADRQQGDHGLGERTYTGGRPRRVRLPEAFFPPGGRGLFSTVRSKTLKKDKTPVLVLPV